MRILLLAPHPFFQERGTPIAVDLLVNALCERGDQVDVLTFHEGENRVYSNASIHRINPLLKIRGISPGFSLKKLYCDFILFCKLIGMLRKNRYDLIHAVEESATMAMLVKPFTNVPYVYDMDSVITGQLLEKSKKFKPVIPIVQYFESKTIKNAQAVVAVCQAIADYAALYKQDNIFLLKDISLISEQSSVSHVDNLRAYTDAEAKIALYIGNLEAYQGIDLLIDSLVVYTKYHHDLCVIVIGGKPDDIDAYKARVAKLDLGRYIKFLGPRPIQDMDAYMKQADLLLSPRIKGINTPMKIYSYLASGIPVLASALPTHTQVMNDDIAFLANPDATAFSRLIRGAITQPEIAAQKARKAKLFIEREHSLSAFNHQVNQIFDTIAAQLARG